MTDYRTFTITVSGKGHQYVAEDTIEMILNDTYRADGIKFVAAEMAE